MLNDLACVRMQASSDSGISSCTLKPVWNTLTGHTHTKKDKKTGKTRVINPGALFRIYPYTIALLDAENDKLEFIEVKGE